MEGIGDSLQVVLGFLEFGWERGICHASVGQLECLQTRALLCSGVTQAAQSSALTFALILSDSSSFPFHLCLSRDGESFPPFSVELPHRVDRVSVPNRRLVDEVTLEVELTF